MTTTWPPNFPILGEGCIRFAQWVNEMSGGRLNITVYGGGELIPALEGFDAVSNGAVELNHGVAYYWAGKVAAAPFFASVPFGMNAQQMEAWIISGGGQELWDKLYRPFNVKPILCGNTGVQMAGWFRRKIETLQDLKGLKMRIPGLGAKVLEKAGGTPVLVSGGEIYTNLERGVIDATEWIGPFHDYTMGFHRVADHYYYPGWHEPGPALEMLVNQQKYAALPSDLQAILQAACARLGTWMRTEFDAKNGTYLKKIMNETDVMVEQLPISVVDELKAFTSEVLQELSDKDKQCREVVNAFHSFRQEIGGWMDIGEKVFYNQIM